VVLDILEEGVKKGDIPDQDITLSAAYIIGMVHRVSVFRIYNRIQENLIHFIDRVTEACWKTLGGGTAVA
jgi:hypothetical protein